MPFLALLSQMLVDPPILLSILMEVNIWRGTSPLQPEAETESPMLRDSEERLCSGCCKVIPRLLTIILGSRRSVFHLMIFHGHLPLLLILPLLLLLLLIFQHLNAHLTTPSLMLSSICSHSQLILVSHSFMALQERVKL